MKSSLKCRVVIKDPKMRSAKPTNSSKLVSFDFLTRSGTPPDSMRNSSIMSNFFNFVQFHTVRNLHFLSKNSTLISRENCRFFGVKNPWKCCGFGLFSCWQLWFDEKNCQKKIGVKNSWKCCGLGLFTCWQLWFHEKNC